MEDKEAFAFIRDYFSELFEKRDISALDRYLHQNYWDDDIGEEGIDHIEDSKAFLEELFRRHPTIAVEVKKAVCQDNVITAYLEWIGKENDRIVILRKGIAIFILKEDKIIKRHTLIYYDTNDLNDL